MTQSIPDPNLPNPKGYGKATTPSPQCCPTFSRMDPSGKCKCCVGCTLCCPFTPILCVCGQVARCCNKLNTYEPQRLADNIIIQRWSMKSPGPINIEVSSYFLKTDNGVAAINPPPWSEGLHRLVEDDLGQITAIIMQNWDHTKWAWQWQTKCGAAALYTPKKTLHLLEKCGEDVQPVEDWCDKQKDVESFFVDSAVLHSEVVFIVDFIENGEKSKALLTGDSIMAQKGVPMMFFFYYSYIMDRKKFTEIFFPVFQTPNLKWLMTAHGPPYKSDKLGDELKALFESEFAHTLKQMSR
eukprot:GFYU01019401.1.p1 GENE.GFYU01019401.1~~GFYU01019401.1.p1  ORF type:complete len:297 (+),score=82.94 GFYU01019401.1:115-1005(+)